MVDFCDIGWQNLMHCLTKLMEINTNISVYRIKALYIYLKQSVMKFVI